MATKREVQPRLVPDVAREVKQRAEAGNRTVPQEVNHALRHHYGLAYGQPSKKKAAP